MSKHTAPDNPVKAVSYPDFDAVPQRFKEILAAAEESFLVGRPTRVAPVSVRSVRNAAGSAPQQSDTTTPKPKKPGC